LERYDELLDFILPRMQGYVVCTVSWLLIHTIS
jgi:hypothetical protein